jgi:8-oxo-dGTP pyrophosphatase MutT (NUDIX family)
MALMWTQKIQKTLPPLATASPHSFSGGLSSVLLLVGIEKRTRREEILLTKRTMYVESHKGQVSLPGGFWEKKDATLVETALRESREEIGARSEDIQLLGALEPVSTHLGVRMFPIVGSLNLPYPFKLNPAEVERVLFLPLQSLLDQGLKPVTVDVDGIPVKSEGIEVDGELVWGATARILHQLRQCLIGS